MTAALHAALAELHQLLKPVDGQWMLIGTTSLHLQGYPAKPQDIDILCTATIAARIAELLADYHQPVDPQLSRHKFRSAFSRYELNGIMVEVMGDLEVNSPKGWTGLLGLIKQPAMVTVEHRQLLLPSLADQQNIYRLFNRDKDKAVLQWLEKQ